MRRGRGRCSDARPWRGFLSWDGAAHDTPRPRGSASPGSDDPGRRTPGALLLCVVAGAEPVDDHDRFVADPPCVVTAGQRRDVAGPGDELGPVVHADGQLPGDVVLEVRRG